MKARIAAGSRAGGIGYRRILPLIGCWLVVTTALIATADPRATTPPDTTYEEPYTIFPGELIVTNTTNGFPIEIEMEFTIECSLAAA